MRNQTVMLTALVAVLVITTTTATSVQASSSNNNECAEKSLFEEIECGVDKALEAYQQGTADGKQAALNGQSNQCPQSDSLSGYCLGFVSGWNKIYYAQQDLNEAQNNDNDDDDGEFIPKRIIGDN